MFERRGAWAKQKKKERAGEDGQAAETKKRETRGCKILEKERRAVTEREARREKGERNRKQRLDRREAKPEKKKEGTKQEQGGFSGSQQLLLSLHRGLRPPPSRTINDSRSTIVRDRRRSSRSGSSRRTENRGEEFV